MTIRSLCVAAGAVLVLGLGFPAPSSAETERVRDPHQEFSQRPALDLESATFQFGAKKLTYRLKIDNLSKKRTQAFARLNLRNYDLFLETKVDASGEERTLGRWSDYKTESYGNRFTDGLTADWDWARDIITITLTKHIRGQRGTLAAYTVAKGAMHGPVKGDYIVAKLNRG